MTKELRWPMRSRFSRRTFLERLGIAAAAAPFVPVLNASGAEPIMPKRLILFFTPHGTVWKDWVPTGSGADFTLSPILKPLETHKSRICVFAGMEILAPGVGAPHTKGLPLLWTASPLLEDMTFTRADGSGGKYFGWNSAASVDQVIAAEIGKTTPFRSLELGVKPGGSHPAARMIYAGAQQPLAPEGNPAAALDRVFGMNRSQTELAALRAQRQSTIDVLAAELSALEKRLPAEDRPKLQSHLDGVRAIEKRLLVDASCAGPTLGATIDASKDENIPQVLDRQIEIMVSALACDLTRVASLQYKIGDNDNAFYRWLGIDFEGHHLITHAGDSDEKARTALGAIYRWYADRFAYLLDKLAAVPEGNGTMLDHTLVVWGSELGKGNSHSFAPTPFVIAGGAGGAVKTGRFFSLDRVPHNRLLVSVCNAMGLANVQKFGATDQGTGPLPGLLA